MYSARSVVPAPMSATATPRSRSVSDSTASPDASDATTSSSTRTPACRTHLVRFWSAVADPWTMCVSTSRRTALMPRGSLTPSWPSTVKSRGRTWSTSRLDGMVTARATSVARSMSSRLTSPMGPADRHRALGVEALHVAAADAHEGRLQAQAGQPLGRLHRRADGRHRLLDVDDLALLEAVRRRRALADDVDGPLPGDLADQRDDLAGADIERHEDRFDLHRSLFPSVRAPCGRAPWGVRVAPRCCVHCPRCGPSTLGPVVHGRGWRGRRVAAPRNRRRRARPRRGHAGSDGSRNVPHVSVGERQQHGRDLRLAVAEQRIQALHLRAGSPTAAAARGCTVRTPPAMRRAPPARSRPRRPARMQLGCLAAEHVGGHRRAAAARPRGPAAGPVAQRQRTPPVRRSSTAGRDVPVAPVTRACAASTALAGANRQPSRSTSQEPPPLRHTSIGCAARPPTVTRGGQGRRDGRHPDRRQGLDARLEVPRRDAEDVHQPIVRQAAAHRAPSLVPVYRGTRDGDRAGASTANIRSVVGEYSAALTATRPGGARPAATRARRSHGTPRPARAGRPAHAGAYPRGRARSRQVRAGEPPRRPPCRALQRDAPRCARTRPRSPGRPPRTGAGRG